jgi:hypothetical protein
LYSNEKKVNQSLSCHQRRWWQRGWVEDCSEEFVWHSHWGEVLVVEDRCRNHQRGERKVEEEELEKKPQRYEKEHDLLKVNVMDTLEEMGWMMVV